MGRLNEFDKLEKENTRTRSKIARLLRKLNFEEQENIWALIDELIENELEQEELCD